MSYFNCIKDHRKILNEEMNHDWVLFLEAASATPLSIKNAAIRAFKQKDLKKHYASKNREFPMEMDADPYSILGLKQSEIMALDAAKETERATALIKAAWRFMIKQNHEDVTASEEFDRFRKAGRKQRALSDEEKAIEDMTVKERSVARSQAINMADSILRDPGSRNLYNVKWMELEPPVVTPPPKGARGGKKAYDPAKDPAYQKWQATGEFDGGKQTKTTEPLRPSIDINSASFKQKVSLKDTVWGKHSNFDGQLYEVDPPYKSKMGTDVHFILVVSLDRDGNQVFLVSYVPGWKDNLKFIKRDGSKSELFSQIGYTIIKKQKRA